MTLARILLKLSALRLWVALGVVLAAVAAVASVTLQHSPVYATASTQMLVDSPQSALTNATVDLTGYQGRASVFARLMTSDEALAYIGKAAGVPGNLIAADGPIEVNGSAAASHAPVDIVHGDDLPAQPIYKLSFVQNPDLPTVDVFAQAPTTKKAIALANGAVTGFANFMSRLNATRVPSTARVEVSELGQATGGMVDPSAGKSTALLVFVAVFLLWISFILFVGRLRANLRAAKQISAGGLFADNAEPGLPSLGAPSYANDLSLSSPAAGARDMDAEPDAGRFHRQLATRVEPGPGSNGRTFVRP